MTTGPPGCKTAANDSATMRRVRIADLRMQGLTMPEIAKEVGVSARTVQADLKRLRDGWQTRMAQSYDAHMATRYERANAIFTKAYKGYAATITAKLPGGNPTLLEVARKAEMDIRTLLGLAGPVEFQGKRVTAEDGQGGGLVDIVEVVVDSREELTEIMNDENVVSLADYKRRLQEAVRLAGTATQPEGTQAIKETGT